MVVGWSNKGDVFVLDRKNYEKEGSEPYKDVYYTGLIAHELVHTYFNAVTEEHCEPIWTSEGIARYLAGENSYEERPKRFSKFLNFFNSSMNNEVYHESRYAVELLIKKYGKTKFIKLIKQFPTITSKNIFNKLFKKIYGFNASYTNFNKLLD